VVTEVLQGSAELVAVGVGPEDDRGKASDSEVLREETHINVGDRRRTTASGFAQGW
jgi:hypothetical protein